MMSPPDSTTTRPVPVLGEDYYLEDGKWVFTELWHRKRGYCCLSTCRHCPWGSQPISERPKPELPRPKKADQP